MKEEYGQIEEEKRLVSKRKDINRTETMKRIEKMMRRKERYWGLLKEGKVERDLRDN